MIHLKLVTFQSIEALNELIEKGYLECDIAKVDVKKMGPTYNWVVDKMSIKVPNNSKAKYPLWCWVKCFDGICPPKHKGTPVDGFDVKITFNKKSKDVFVTDFRRYSFLLNNMYIPKDKKDKEQFERKLKDLGITSEDLIAFVRRDKYKKYRNDRQFLNICEEIRKSFDRCITKDSNILQGCVWRINIEEVEKIELLDNDGYVYGSLNYIRSNGKRMDWIADYYKRLK